MGQVSISYTGVQQVERVEFLDTHGLYPASGTLWIIPQATVPFVVGVFSMSDGDNYFEIPNCKIDQASLQVNVETGMVSQFTFFDVRWKCAFGAVSGDYNEKLWDGSIADGRDRTARQLAALCLDAIGLPYNVSAFPDDDYPRALWDCSNPRGALGLLMSIYGIDFVVDRYSQYLRAVVVGSGDPLPTGSTSSFSYSIDLAELPDFVEICPHPTVYQQKLKLELRMLDTDGKWKDPDDVSYKPADGWEKQSDPADLIPDQEGTYEHVYANTYGYRAYAITGMADGTLEAVEYGDVGQIENIEIRERLAEAFVTSGSFYNISRDLEPIIHGEHTVRSKPDVENDADINTDECDVLDVAFSIDTDQLMVFFRENMFRIYDNAGEQELKPAILYLTTSFYIKDPTTYIPVRPTAYRTLASNGTAPYFDHRPDIVRRVIAQYENESDCKEVTSSTNNDDNILPRISTALDAAAAKFPVKASTMQKYNGVVPIQLDGLRTQVLYLANLQTGADTIAWLGTEMAPGGVRRHERERLYRQTRIVETERGPRRLKRLRTNRHR